MTDLQVTQSGQFVRGDLPQVGYVSKIWVTMFGTITTGTAAAGNWSNYFPQNIVNSISLRSNEGLEIYRTNGYSNMLVQQLYHGSYSPGLQTDPTGYLATAFGMRTAGIAGPAANTVIASSTTYNIAATFVIPVAADDRLSAGLLLLQNQATRASLEIGINQLVGNGGINGFGNATATLGTGASISLTFRPVVEFFAVPADPNSQPNTDFIHRWIEDTLTYTASGDQIYKVPVNGIISRLIVDVENNGAQYPWFSASGNPNLANFGNFTTQYAASMTPEVEDGRVALFRNRWNYQQDLPDGCHVFEYSMGGGSVEMGWDGRDTYDTSQLTEFLQKINLTVAPTSGKIRCIRQELQRRAG
jgi:hypothetical protein